MSALWPCVPALALAVGLAVTAPVLAGDVSAARTAAETGAAPACTTCDARQAAKRKLREARQSLLPEPARPVAGERAPPKSAD